MRSFLVLSLLMLGGRSFTLLEAEWNLILFLCSLSPHWFITHWRFSFLKVSFGCEWVDVHVWERMLLGARGVLQVLQHWHYWRLWTSRPGCWEQAQSSWRTLCSPDHWGILPGPSVSVLVTAIPATERTCPFLMRAQDLCLWDLFTASSNFILSAVNAS